MQKCRQFFEDYRVRNPRSATFAEYALGHVKRLLGKTMVVDVTDETVKDYQTDRLKEKASPKSINEEIGFLLRVLGEQGDFLRAKMRRTRMRSSCPARSGVAQAFTVEQKAALLAEAKARRSPVHLSGADAGASRGNA